jgi:hypothetical protein
MAEQKLTVNIGANTKEFDEKLKGTNKGVQGFGKELGTIAAAGAAAAGAIAILTDWFKKTEAGVDMLNTTMIVSRQLLTDLIMKQETHLMQSIQLADRANKIRQEDRYDLVKEAQLNRDIRKYRLEAYSGEASIQEKIIAQTKAIEKQKELEAYRKADLFEELKLVEDRLKLDQINTELLDRQAQLMAAIFNADESESLRMVSYLNGLLKEAKTRAFELADAFTAIKEEAIQIDNMPINFFGTTTLKAPSFKQADNILAPSPKLTEVTKGLTDQQEALLGLSDTFAGFFSDVNLGFQGMIDGVITGIKRLVMELMAKAAFMAILSLIFPASAVPFTLKNILGGNAATLVGGSTVLSTVGTGGGFSAMNNVTGERLIAGINGKELRIVLSRS